MRKKSLTQFSLGVFEDRVIVQKNNTGRFILVSESQPHLVWIGNFSTSSTANKAAKLLDKISPCYEDCSYYDEYAKWNESGMYEGAWVEEKCRRKYNTSVVTSSLGNTLVLFDCNGSIVKDFENEEIAQEIANILNGEKI